ncbi:Oligosaccaryltransferase-domain-containing protein [Bisporella sp. PMI_857]|nr:Oligosaccaryltransferase-domain-containing protein [Bisporella sp. PMI_857]
MISDDSLYRLAVFLGSAAMLLIVLYHFLEVNAVEEPEEAKKPSIATPQTGAKSGSTIR